MVLMKFKKKNGVKGIGKPLKIACTNLKKTYFIHCSLVASESNLFNGKRSNLLAHFRDTGKLFEFVRYSQSGEIPFRDCGKISEVSTIDISIKDNDGRLFDFNGCPLLFEVEVC